MEQDNKQYEFKAINEKLFALSFLMILPLFVIIYFIMDKYLFYNEKRYDVFTNLKIFGLPFILSLGFVFIISYLFFVKKYALEIKNHELYIYSNNSILYSLPYEQVKEIKFVQSKKNNSSSLQFYANKKIVLIIGYFMYKKNDFYKYNTQVKYFIEDYLIQTDSKQEVIENTHNSTIIITKKD